MRIGLIGAGPFGLALARRLARVGTEVVIADDGGGDALAALRDEFAAHIALGPLTAAAEPEIVILALPPEEIEEAVAPIADWEGRIVIDATVAGADPPGQPSAPAIADMLPNARVVRAFATLPAAALEAEFDPAAGRLVIFCSGDHPRPKQAAARLIEQMGFAAVDLGTLAEGGRLQSPGGSLFGLRLLRLP